MNKTQLSRLLVLLIIVLSIFSHSARALSVDTLSYGNFGKIVIYKPGSVPNSVVLFLSGDGGWNMGVIEMSQSLVQQGALVAGLDIKLYLKRLNSLSLKCYYPAADFEDVSLMLQKRYKLASYNKPILVGYSSGAVWVYGDLPVVLVPTALKDDSRPMVFLISGDGGWTSFDHSLAEALAEKGMPVVGLDAQKYFWNHKTPDEAALEVGKAVEHYLHQWNRKKFILVGYSFGANVIPFIAEKLSDSTKDLLSGIYCLSPSEKADFEIHLTDMLGFGGENESYQVPNEIKKVKQFKSTCIFGEEEEEALRLRFREAGAQILTVPGNHHYNKNPAAAAEAIFKEVEKSSN